MIKNNQLQTFDDDDCKDKRLFYSVDCGYGYAVDQSSDFDFRDDAGSGYYYSSRSDCEV